MGTASRLTIEENMAIAQRRGKSRGLSWGVREKDRELFREALKELNIGLENRLKVDTQYLSGGQRQALTLVMAALVKPKLLLLDEQMCIRDRYWSFGCRRSGGQLYDAWIKEKTIYLYK